MFETHREAEVFLPEIFHGDENIQNWGHVSTRLNTLWLYVNCEPVDKKVGVASKMFLITEIMDLLAIQADTSSTISEAYVVSPGYMNGSDVWEMNLLDHVLTGIEPMTDVEQHALIYVLKNGQRLVDSSLGTKEDDLKNTQLCCQI